MGLVDIIGKKYKLDSSENFDAYMKALGKYIFIYVIIFFNLALFW